MTWAIEENDYSQRRACKLVVIEPETYRYASRRPDDAAIREGATARIGRGAPSVRLTSAPFATRLNQGNTCDQILLMNEGISGAGSADTSQSRGIALASLGMLS